MLLDTRQKCEVLMCTIVFHFVLVEHPNVHILKLISYQSTIDAVARHLEGFFFNAIAPVMMRTSPQ